MKEELYDINWLFFGGKPPNPHGRLRRVLGSLRSSAKQSYAFCFFFWKKKIAPKPPWSDSPRFGSPKTLCEAELRFLLLFLEKEDSPQTPMVGFAEIWVA
jgi:hypothetical protein